MPFREIYRTFCAQAPDMPLFMQDWYLDAACGPANWQVIFVRKGGKVAGVLPYFLKQKLHWHYVAMPPLVKMMGPYLLPEFRTARHETGLLRQLIEQLPPLAAFEQDFNYTATNWLPFYWQDFRQTTRYSYVLDLTVSLETLEENLAPDYRNNKLPKAAEQVQVHTGNDLELFYRMHNQSFQRQGMAAPVSFSFYKLLTRYWRFTRPAKFFGRPTAKQAPCTPWLTWPGTSIRPTTCSPAMTPPCAVQAPAFYSPGKRSATPRNASSCRILILPAA